MPSESWLHVWTPPLPRFCPASRAGHPLPQSRGRAGKATDRTYTVVKEAAFVFLHPSLGWSDDHDWIEVIGGQQGPLRPVYADFGQAPDDDLAKLAIFARRVRRGQPKFRKKLLELYGARCAVSGWEPPEVLEAAHIRLHSESGINHTDNGILLRADLHVLFDEGLLRIDPDTCTVVVDPSLRDTSYWTLHGNALRDCMDETRPNREYLLERWKSPSDLASVPSTIAPKSTGGRSFSLL